MLIMVSSAGDTCLNRTILDTCENYTCLTTVNSAPFVRVWDSVKGKLVVEHMVRLDR